MSRAALALGVKGGNFVSERINKNLGLDAMLSCPNAAGTRLQTTKLAHWIDRC